MAATDYDRMKELTEFDESKKGVRGLSESGITSIPRIFMHPPQNLPQRKSSPSSSVSIPVIDLSNLDSKEHRPKIVEQIREASKTWGFFQVVNHGVAVSTLEDTINAIKSFHEQPHEEKAKHYVREEGRGVMYASNNDLYRAEAASWLDSITVWMAPQPPMVEQIPEICRKEALDWDKHAKGVAETVMELLCEGLELESSKFKDLTFTDTRVFVGHYYPYCPQPDLTMGIISHTDPAMITVLLQNQIAGLQVKHNDEWVDVKPLPGGLIINIGDFLQIVSNGTYRSVEHRVLANGCKESRISIVMFFNLGKWRESDTYGPLPELVSPEKPAIYREFTQKEYNENFYSKGLDSKSFVSKVTI